MLEQNTISFLSEDISFSLKGVEAVRKWIQNIIISENKQVGEIAYIFCSDDYLHQINLEHLAHDTYTDIITFNYCEEDMVSADVFISIDRVKENAALFTTSFGDELHRVMAHGILHLVGYNDKTKEEKKCMRSKEDFYISLRSD